MSRSRAWVVLAATLAALATQLGSAQADGGALDPTFGTDGLAITANPVYHGTEGSDVLAVAVQADGKIVVGGHIHPADAPRQVFTLERYTSNGALDPSFGSNGVVTTDLGYDWEQVRGIAIQPDGKIVAAGVDGGALALARYTTDGTLDVTFGAGAIPGTEVDGSLLGGAEAVALQPDGKIVVAGGLYGMSLARYTSDGTLDATFGSAGVVTPPPRPAEYGKDLAIAPDDKIVVVGSRANGAPDGADRSVLVERFNPDGSSDLGFGAEGAATVTVGSWDYGNAVALQPDGKILVAVTTQIGNSLSFGLVRLRADGTPDPSFGEKGIVITGDTTDRRHVGGASTVLLAPDGTIVVGGDGSSWRGGADFALGRYLADGSLDESFGEDGIVMTHFGATPHGGGSSGVVRAAALQPDGKIVAVGPIMPSDPSGGENGFGVARYLNSDTHKLSISKPYSSGSGSVTSSPAGIDCDVICEKDAAQFAAVSTVTLTAEASRGSVLSWSGACAGKRQVCTVSMGQARSVVARFYRCVVPRVKGKRLAAAERAIRGGHCLVGRITRRFSRTVARGRVIWQGARAGVTRAAFARIGLAVSKGRGASRTSGGRTARR